MLQLRTRIREIHAAYDDAVNKYKEDLQEAQGQCSHGKVSRWEYRLDTYGAIASNEDGVVYLFQECHNCGHIAKKLIDCNYDSEIPF